MGNDTPGSWVTLKVKKAQQETGWGSTFISEERLETVELQRLPSQLLADRRALLALLNKMTEYTRQDKEASAASARALELWKV